MLAFLKKEEKGANKRVTEFTLLSCSKESRNQGNAPRCADS